MLALPWLLLSLACGFTLASGMQSATDHERRLYGTRQDGRQQGGDGEGRPSSHAPRT